MNRTALVGLVAVIFSLGACSSPARRIRKNEAKFTAFPPQDQREIRAGRVEPGFTKGMVLIALGKSDRQYIRRTNAGTQEVWAYIEYVDIIPPDLDVATGGGYSVKDRGVVTGGHQHFDEKTRIIFQGGVVAKVERRKTT